MKWGFIEDNNSRNIVVQKDQNDVLGNFLEKMQSFIPSPTSESHISYETNMNGLTQLSNMISEVKPVVKQSIEWITICFPMINSE